MFAPPPLLRYRDALLDADRGGSSHPGVPVQARHPAPLKSRSLSGEENDEGRSRTGLRRRRHRRHRRWRHIVAEGWPEAVLAALALAGPAWGAAWRIAALVAVVRSFCAEAAVRSRARGDGRRTLRVAAITGEHRLRCHRSGNRRALAAAGRTASRPGPPRASVRGPGGPRPRRRGRPGPRASGCARPPRQGRG